MSSFFEDAFKSVYVIYGFYGLIGSLLLVALAFSGRYVLIKWLDNRFQQSLEFYKSQTQAVAEHQKHELQKLIEDKKYEINTRFDRTTRINQLEFEKLPELWAKLIDAVIQTRGLMGFRQYLDVSRLSDDKLKRHMVRIEFSENQIEQVMGSNDRSKAYQTITDAIDFNKAAEAFNQYTIKMRSVSIFIRPDILPYFKEFEDSIKLALIDYESMSKGYPSGRMHEHGLVLGDQADGKLDKLQNEVRNRLWNSMAAKVD